MQELQEVRLKEWTSVRWLLRGRLLSKVAIQADRVAQHFPRDIFLRCRRAVRSHTCLVPKLIEVKNNARLLLGNNESNMSTNGNKQVYLTWPQDCLGFSSMHKFFKG